MSGGIIGLLRREPTRPINDSAIRVSGAELLALARSHLRTYEALNEQYERVCAELAVADPSSIDGQNLQELLIDLTRVASRLGCCSALIDVAERMKLYQLTAQAATAPALVSAEDRS